MVEFLDVMAAGASFDSGAIYESLTFAVPCFRSLGRQVRGSRMASGRRKVRNPCAHSATESRSHAFRGRSRKFQTKSFRAAGNASATHCFRSLLSRCFRPILAMECGRQPRAD